MTFEASWRDEHFNLQAALSIASAPERADLNGPHHPITCPDDLRLEEDGTFACGHASVPPGDVRTQYCIDHTVALLLMELSREL